MKRPSEGYPPPAGDDPGGLRGKLMGLGERSMRKTYYPELRERMEELERFRILLDNISDLIFVVEAGTGRIVDMNETAWRKTGRSRAGLMGSQLKDLVSPEQVEAMSGLLASGGTSPGDKIFDLPLAGGGRFPAEVTLNTLGGGHFLSVAVARDVSARMESQMELARAWGYLRSIVDAMPSMLVCVNGNLEVTLLNATCAKITGVDSELGRGMRLTDVLPWLPELPASMRQTIQDGRPRVLRKMPGRGTGGPAWYDATIFPLDQRGAEAVARIDDVTARVRMEEVLVQTEKMLSVGALAAGVAHEINNPLAGILQGTQSVLRRFDPQLEANTGPALRAGLDLNALQAYLEDRGILNMLKAIQDSGVRASRIVGNILEFSRRSDLSKVLASLPEVADKALELAVSEFDLKKKFDFRHIHILREDDSSLPSVWCVPNQIEQVVLNLLKNAAQALSAGQIEDPRITIRTGWMDGMACLEVEDNGPGMDEATRERVFEPFFTTKKPGEGTGLGLSVVYYIVVEQHLGRVGVRSAPGAGTAISIRLPVGDPGKAGGGM